jgi:hypothetical protein
MIIDSKNGRHGIAPLYNSQSGIHLFWKTIGNQKDRKKLKEKILAIGDVQGRRTNLKAAMTSWDSWRDIAFQPLAEIITKEIVKISSKHYHRPDIKWRLNSMWGASYSYLDSADLHDHYPATWSCVYYVDVPPKSSPLIFPSPKITIKPWDGLLVIFPGNMSHLVPTSHSQEPRVVISANFYIDKLL